MTAGTADSWQAEDKMRISLSDPQHVMDNVVGRSVTGNAPAGGKACGQMQVDNFAHGPVIRAEVVSTSGSVLPVRVVILIELNGLQLFAALGGCRRGRIKHDKAVALMEPVEDVARPCEMRSARRSGACMKER